MGDLFLIQGGQTSQKSRERQVKSPPTGSHPVTSYVIAYSLMACFSFAKIPLNESLTVP